MEAGRDGTGDAGVDEGGRGDEGRCRGGDEETAGRRRRGIVVRGQVETRRRLGGAETWREGETERRRGKEGRRRGHMIGPLLSSGVRRPRRWTPAGWSDSRAVHDVPAIHCTVQRPPCVASRYSAFITVLISVRRQTP